MPLGVLNNISAIYAENNLNTTQTNLQNTLQQLSSGSRINSGADDAAGLSIANGLQANSSALTQSSSNATAGVGFLQVADGALSQVTNLLNRAVTLATEAGGGTLTSSQMSAADQEYQDILSQINTIGGTTEYNGIQVFGADKTASALTWSNVLGGTTPNSAASSTPGAVTAAAVAGGNIVAGGTTAGTNATQGGTFAASPTALTWTAGGAGTTGVITSSAITNGSQLSGTFAFTPTHNGGSPNGISVTLGTAITSTNLATQASQLQDAINTQATGSASTQDYTVTVVNGNQLQIGLGTHAGADNLTGFNAPTQTGSAAAAQTAGTYQMTVANGDSLSGTLTLTGLTSTTAGTASAVVFAGQATTTVTGAIGSGNTLAGSLTITSNAGVTGAGSPTAFSWTNAGTSSSATITNNSLLSGGFTLTTTGGPGGTVDVDLTGKTTANVVATINAALGANAADYTVGYNSGTGALSIAVSAAGTTAGISATSIANDASAATFTPPGTLTKTINLNGVTTNNLVSTINAGLGAWAGDFTVGYSSGSLSIAVAAGGTAAGITSLTESGGMTQATSAVTTALTPTTINLNGTSTANLASVVNQALNGNGANPNYTVGYNSTTGVLSVGLTAAATTNNITGISWNAAPSGNITQAASNTASLTFTSNEMLGGKLTINQTIAGAAQSAITVDLSSGVNTDHNAADLVTAITTALGNNAQYYSVSAQTVNQNTTVSMSINQAGINANVDSISIANGTGNNALSQSQITEANITGSAVMGGFTLTPSGSSTTPIVVNLAGQSTSNTDLVSALQTALGSNYVVGMTPVNLPANPAPTTPPPLNDNLTIGVSAAGVAAGITGFTIANAATNGVQQLSQSAAGVNIYTSDGTSAGSKNYNVTIGALSQSSVGSSSLNSVQGTQITATVGGVTGTGGTSAGATVGTSLSGTSLASQANAEAALQTVTNAISAVAYQRGQVGANINTLTAASNIASSEETNVQSAQNTITATDYASATSNLSKYEILTQTGISALAQANSTQQMVLKLLQ